MLQCVRVLGENLKEKGVLLSFFVVGDFRFGGELQGFQGLGAVVFEVS